MKKLISLLLTTILLFALFGCNNSTSGQTSKSTVSTDQIYTDRAVTEIMNRGGYGSCEIKNSPNSNTHTDSVSVIFKKYAPYGDVVRTDTCIYVYNQSSDTWSYYDNQGWKFKTEYKFNSNAIVRTWKGEFRSRRGWTYEITITDFNPNTKTFSAYGSIYDNNGNEFGVFMTEDCSLRPTDGALYVNDLATSSFPINISIDIYDGVTCSG